MLFQIHLVVVDAAVDWRLYIYPYPQQTASAAAATTSSSSSSSSSNEVSPLMIETRDRDTLLKWLESAWCSDFILRRGRSSVFPVYIINVNNNNNNHKENNYLFNQSDNLNLKIQPFIGTQQVSYDGYTFMLYKDFEDRAGVTAALQTGCYVDSRGVEVQLLLLMPLSVTDLAPLGRADVTHVAAGFRRALLDASPFAALLRSCSYTKKMNLADDAAQWTGWQLWVRNEEANIIAIVLRRMYTPPTMDGCQDMILTYKISHEDQKEFHLKEDDLLREAEFIADSISSESLCSCATRDILQAKIDALLLHDEAYHWLYMNCRLTPKWIGPAKIFLKSILAILQNEGVLADDDLLDAVGSSVAVVDDPMEVAYEIIRQGEGIEDALRLPGVALNESYLSISNEEDACTPQSDAAMILHRWAQRVASYLSFCIHEGILINKFKLQDLAEAVGLVSPEADKKLRAVLSFILHLRPKDFSLPWTPQALNNPQKFLKRRDYVFNHKPFLILLECGYIAKLFPKHEETAYMEMLRALLSGAKTAGFRASVCKQILKASALSTKKNTTLLHCILPALVQTIQAKEAVSSGSTMPLLHLCAASLVNLSAGDPRTKEILLEGGVHSACLTLLKTKEANVVLAALLLLLNLTKLAAHRQKFLAAGGLYPIVDLLMHNYASDLPDRRALLSALMGVVGQLANDEEARADLIDRFPVVDFVLYAFHTAGEDVEYKTKIVFALRQLSRSRWQVQQRVCKHLLHSLAAALYAFSSVEFVGVCLSLLQTLAGYKPNCFDMKAAGIQEALMSMLRRTKLDILYHRVANLQERINTQTKYDYFAI